MQTLLGPVSFVYCADITHEEKRLSAYNSQYRSIPLKLRTSFLWNVWLNTGAGQDKMHIPKWVCTSDKGGRYENLVQQENKSPCCLLSYAMEHGKTSKGLRDVMWLETGIYHHILG